MPWSAPSRSTQLSWTCCAYGARSALQPRAEPTSRLAHELAGRVSLRLSRSGMRVRGQPLFVVIFPIGNTAGLSAVYGAFFPDRESSVTTEQIGDVVRQARLAQGLRQDQLAAAAGVGVRFLVELERGKPTVRLAKVLAVLDALGCRLQVTPPPAARANGS